MRTSVAPGETKTVTVVLAWHFPHRWHFGQMIGNNYNNHFENSAAAASYTAESLPSIIGSIAAWNAACTGNDLSALLRDFLVNSVSTIAKTGVWAASNKWRQFESFSADDIDPVHIHLYRSIPYAWFWYVQISPPLPSLPLYLQALISTPHNIYVSTLM